MCLSWCDLAVATGYVCASNRSPGILRGASSRCQPCGDWLTAARAETRKGGLGLGLGCSLCGSWFLFLSRSLPGTLPTFLRLPHLTHMAPSTLPFPCLPIPPLPGLPTLPRIPSTTPPCEGTYAWAALSLLKLAYVPDVWRSSIRLYSVNAKHLNLPKASP
ncbi:hypothetical protein B0T19DRAFT_40381 [Cercophora scortea]|uniref:Uncharacterized protein n=1 Tax=Cercophora scortea TaxID=314031 RepID=A0AAE0J416_9PEZI|nr:hypothetical protein B0T19DRAFT_40381 [Cercophora scortea]